MTTACVCQVRRLLALCVLGLIVSDSPSEGDAGNRRGAALLEAADMPGVITCRHAIVSTVGCTVCVV